MKSYYAVFDNGEQTLEGIISEEDLGAFLNMGFNVHLPTCLDIDDLKALIAQMEKGEINLTVDKLKEFHR